jgi:hypothetical protein
MPRTSHDASNIDDLTAALAGDTGEVEGEVTAVETDPAAAVEVEHQPEPAPETDPAPETGEDADEAPESVADALRDAELAVAAVKAPDHWSAEDKAKFNALPNDAARQTLLDWRKQIETGANEKFTAAAEARKLHEEVSQHLAPYADAMKAEGISTQDAVRRLFAAEQALRTDPANALLTLASQYGRGVAGTPQAREFVQRMAEQLGVAIGAPGGQAGASSDTSALDTIQARLTAFEQRDQAARTETAQRALSAAQTTLKSFVESKSDDGKPAHPHFEKVRGHMAVLIQSAQQAGETLTLSDAYERSVWADPELRQTLITERATADAAKAAAARKAHADQASRARTPNTRPSNAPSPSPDRTVREDLEEAFREQRAS